MPAIAVDLPTGLLEAIKSYATANDTDAETIVLWSVAEKIGELKHEIISNSLETDTRDMPYPVIQKLIPQEDFIMHFEFEGGMEATMDMKPILNRVEAFSDWTV